MELLPDPSIRLKVTNDCQWTCDFCHNEGTELPDSQTKRVSVFLDPAVSVLSPIRNLDADLEVLKKVAELKELGVREVHLTGGEPTLNPNLPTIVSYLSEQGLWLKMTTNGQARSGLMEDLVNRGLSAATFSVLSFTPEEFLKTQKIKSIAWAENMIKRNKANILVTKGTGATVKINTVVINESDYDRVELIRQFAEENNIELALLNSLGEGVEAANAVFGYLESKGGIPGTEIGFINSSTYRRPYALPSGQIVMGKGIRPLHPNIVCDGCEHKGRDTCVEKFYGIRVELRDQLYVRLCVQKNNSQTVMTLDDFISKGVYYSLL